MCLCSDMGVKQNTQEVENYLSRPITVKHVRVVQSKFRPKSKCQYFSINIWKHVLCIKSEWAWVVWKAGHRRSRGSRCLSSTCCSNTLWRAWTAALIIHPGLCINKPFPLLPPLLSPLQLASLPPLPRPISLSLSPETACSGMALMGKNLAAGGQYVTCFPEMETGSQTEVWQVCAVFLFWFLFAREWQVEWVCACMFVLCCACNRFPDWRFKGCRLTGWGQRASLRGEGELRWH